MATFTGERRRSVHSNCQWRMFRISWNCRLTRCLSRSLSALGLHLGANIRCLVSCTLYLGELSVDLSLKGAPTVSWDVSLASLLLVLSFRCSLVLISICHSPLVLCLSHNPSGTNGVRALPVMSPLLFQRGFVPLHLLA